MRFGDVSIGLLSILLPGEEAVPEDLQSKDLPASTCYQGAVLLRGSKALIPYQNGTYAAYTQADFSTGLVQRSIRRTFGGLS